jgi:hypothetical protein
MENGMIGPDSKALPEFLKKEDSEESQADQLARRLQI